MPRFLHTGDNDLLLCVAKRCPSLEHLAVVDDDSVAPGTWVKLFSLQDLSRLDVASPGSECMSAISKHATKLTHLSLADVGAICTEGLVYYFQHHAQRLQVLRLGFQLPEDMWLFQPHPLPKNYKCPMKTFLQTFLEYIVHILHNKMPGLKRLQISSSPLCMTQHDDASVPPSHPESKIFNTINHLDNFLKERRETNARRLQASQLEVVRVRATKNWLPHCIQPLENLFGENTRVELEFPGVSLVFPPDAQNSILRLVQIDNVIGDYATLFENKLHRVETLDVGAGSFVTAFEENGRKRMLVRTLAKRAAPYIIRIRVRITIGSKEFLQQVVRYVIEILKLTPNVRYVEVSREIVEYMSSNDEDCKQLMASFRGLRVLHLNSPEKYFGNRFGAKGRKRSMERSCRRFAGRLKVFLNLLAAECRSLECVLLEQEEIEERCDRHEMANLLETAIGAVEVYEEAAPRVDVGTVKAQLENWMSHCKKKTRMRSEENNAAGDIRGA